MALVTLITLSREGYDRIVAVGEELGHASPFLSAEVGATSVTATVYIMQAIAIVNCRLPDETAEQTILRLIQTLVDEAETKVESAVEEFLARAMGNKRPI